MKVKNYLLVLAVYISSFAVAQTGDTVRYSITIGGVPRTYLVYVPAVYNLDSANHSHLVPLVLNIHGLGSNMVQQLVYGDFRPIADTANFIIALPQGTGSPATFNNFGNAVDATDPDVVFMSNIIDALKSKYNINLDRVYSTGMSNGGFMTDELACQLSRRITATASVCGDMVQAHYDACKAHNPIPHMEIHGTTDNVVPYDGTPSPTVYITSVHIDTLVKHWVLHNRCNPVPAIDTLLPNIDVADNCTVEHFVYTGGSQRSTVELYKVIGGGHSWPTLGSSTSGTNGDFNASKAIWRFFSQYTSIMADIPDLPSPSTGMNEPSAVNDVSVYPNPSNGKFTVSVNDYQNASIKIYNLTGEVVLDETIYKPKTIIHLHVSKGVYIYQVKSNNSLKNEKLIIQ